MTCTVTLPDDTQVSIPVRHVSTGVYEAGVPVTVPGLHLISWAATGVNASAWDDSFTASDPARVYPLSLREVKALLGMETHTYDDVLDQAHRGRARPGRTTPGTCSAAAPSP